MKTKQVLTSSLGNTLEWFDFGLFIFMAPIIGEKFFPASTPTLATLHAFIAFAAGFICRPLGGILFGHLGDTQGRARTLRFSVLTITLSTLLIGFLPTYATIGILAPILFTLLRLLQGISIGGGYSGVIIYLAEAAPSKNRGFFTSFAASSANLGFLLATLAFMEASHFFSAEIFNAWGWRLPFILVGIPAVFIVYYRFKLLETRTYLQLQMTHHLTTHPFLTALRQAPKNLLKILGLTCISSTLYYIFFGFMLFYLEHYDAMHPGLAFKIQITLLIAMLFLVPVAGWCGDYFSRKKILIVMAASSLLLAWPCFYLLQSHSLLGIWLALSIATILSSLDQGNSLTAVVENCPANVRYSGIAFSYNLGMAVFGGTAPMVVMLLTEYVSLLAPAYYLMVMSTLSLLAALTLLSKNKMLS